MPSKKPRILSFLNYYLPGYEAGGPLRTLANMVDHLGDEFEFYIVTRDRDINDSAPYENVVPDHWQTVGKAQVYYVSPRNETVASFKRLMAGTPHDMVYLNSFFDAGYTLKPLLARRLSARRSQRPIIVAPRGEFSSAALQLKSLKKRVYVRAMKLARLYGDAVFQASSDYEAADIAKAFGIPQERIRIAMDLPTKVQPLSPSDSLVGEHGDEEKLRVIFLSRITPMKNLDFALRVLAKVSATLRFDIYGPVSDQDYWEKCQALMKSLPANVMATYCGSVAPARVAQLFSKYDLFFLPTRGENYGHVIAEALSMGTPVLISDQTPWRELQADGVGWDIPLASVAEFACTIQALAMRSSAERRVTRRVIQQHAIKRLLSPAVLEANRRLFTCR